MASKPAARELTPAKSAYPGSPAPGQPAVASARPGAVVTASVEGWRYKPCTASLVVSSLPHDLGDDARPHRASPLSNRKARPLFERNRHDQLHPHRHIISPPH